MRFPHIFGIVGDVINIHGILVYMKEIHAR